MKALVLILALFVLPAQAASKSGQQQKGRTGQHDALVECGMYYMFSAEQAKRQHDEFSYQVNTRLLRIAMAYAVSLNLPESRLEARREIFVSGVNEMSKTKSSNDVQNELAEKHSAECFQLMKKKVSRKN